MGKEFTNRAFGDASELLLRYCESLETPQVILEGIAILYEKPLKLMCWVGEPQPANGTPAVKPGFYASDLFEKLLKAFGALDWELVGILIEQAQTPLLAAQ